MRTHLDIDSVRRHFPNRQISFFDSITSTMHEATALAEAGCASGTAVVAEEQTSGQGRHGHSWHSEAGAGLYLSLVLRLESEAFPILTLALGLAVAEAIARGTELHPDLRWPNDIMLGEKKTAGILVQLVDRAAIAGIGINVNHPSFPPEIAHEATSLRLATGRALSREDLLVALLQAIDSFTYMLSQGGRQPILDLFTRRSSYVSGKRVQVDQPGGLIVGTTAGLDPAGFLKLRTDDGKESLILAGGVRPV